MIKVPEYMAMGSAIASYDLPETRVSAGPAAEYAAGSDPAALGACVNRLLDDPERRREMGRQGRERVVDLAWGRSAESLVAAYEHAIGSDRAGLGERAETPQKFARVPG